MKKWIIAALVLAASWPAHATTYIFRGELGTHNRGADDKVYEELKSLGYARTNSFSLEVVIPFSKIISRHGIDYNPIYSLSFNGGQVSAPNSISKSGVIESNQIMMTSSLINGGTLSIDIWRPNIFNAPATWTSAFMNERGWLAEFVYRAADHSILWNTSTIYPGIESVDVIGDPVEFALPVPEPENWALLIVGMIVVGSTARASARKGRDFDNSRSRQALPA